MQSKYPARPHRGGIGEVVTIQPDGADTHRLRAGHVIGQAVAHVHECGDLEPSVPQRSLVEPRVRLPRPVILGEDREEGVS